MTYLVNLANIQEIPRSQLWPLLGGKAATLSHLKQANFPVPDGFVITANAFIDSLTEREYSVIFQPETSLEKCREIISNIQLNPQVKKAIFAELEPDGCLPLIEGELLAVRSSAIDEDSSQYSWAGQYQTFLGVGREQLIEKIIGVWLSGFSEQVLAYRQQQGISGQMLPPLVLIQKMLNPDVSGVAFAADPVTGKRRITVINAVFGLAVNLVTGEVNADTYRVDRFGNIREKQMAEPNVAQPVLNDLQIKAVAQLVRQVSDYLARPQDIEWAIETRENQSFDLYLLQSRSITNLANIPDPDGVLNLWDNSNISESYHGITTPLTFSFAQRAYEEVYRQFCRLLGVPLDVIQRHNDTFGRMIGLIKGRIYYNLLSWYQVLSMLPGFRLNRRFMEQMMGVKEPLPDYLIKELEKSTWSDRLQDFWRLLKSLIGLIVNYWLLPYKIQQFYQRLNQVLSLPKRRLSKPKIKKIVGAVPRIHARPADEVAFLASLEVDDLVAYYRQIERQLLSQWDAPLINDFFAMIFYGILRNLTQKLYDDRTGKIADDLVRGTGEIISIEPAKRMKVMANLVVEYPEKINLLCEGSLGEIEQVLEDLPRLKLLYENYLVEFGDRCWEELKLESLTLHDDPLPLFRTIGQLAANKNNKPQTSDSRFSSTLIEPNLPSKLGWNLIFNWVVKNARERIRDRENLRWERTRVFARARRVFREIGKRFYALDLLKTPADIFYLEVDEIIGIIEGTASCLNLRGLVALRKAEFAKYKESPGPEDRFFTRGIVYQNLISQKVTLTATNGSCLQGIGCSPGIAKGIVKVVKDPRQINKIPPETIVVADRTDPGWILILAAATGILVEKGSLLSHVAIVARELKIPAVTALPGITQYLKDGDLVELDGGTGMVYKLLKEEQ